MSFCLLLALLTLTAHTQVTSGKSLKLLQEQWRTYTNDCIQSFISTPPASGLVCNRTFDQYVCWTDGSPGTTVNVSCPWYLPWYQKVQRGLVYRVCGADGKWAHGKNTSECEQDEPGQKQYGQILSKFRAMYTIGYSLSLGALILALGILVTFRKLHCMRNNIHMNLFGSFILRALFILIKDALLDKMNSAPTGSHHFQGQHWVSVQTTAGCRAAMVMMQYSVMANNYWLLVEGLYLHSLLVTTVFSERNYFYIYLFIGWGAPLIFVLPWVTLKYLYENEECWERNINMGYWWIIRSPILFAYLVQSEMLKKWKRWKLGKDIDEEYRNTYSQTAHAKSASIALVMTHECPETPELLDSASPAAESHHLVSGFQNGVSRNRGRARLQLTSEPQEGASNCSSLSEDIFFEERQLNSECSAVVTESNV
ncbi:glucagon receptor-like isoform X3 [Xyrauchen texanus]|uniref:glucagon receptor-like isoform X3 n=1 Tax=Xyrauchen texanus TaxID=154827 RepID=UPI00224289ED|nr:glucagon receptor-like isoform X3 [Xyrauchen texanus]